MARYLVTGGCGFIGTHLCRSLLRDGHAVRVLDDLSTGRRDNLAHGADLLVGDLGDPATLAAALAGIDGCFHLAAIASVMRGTTDWVGTNRVNLAASIALFDAVAKLPGGRRRPVVYVSSAAVYGDGDRQPISEASQTRPLSAYGADKLAMELHARVATLVHRVPTVGIRPFNVYGPLQDPASPYSGVISIFCERIRAGAPVTIYGDGAQTRDFVFVADVVAALRAAMKRLPGGAPVFNVCTGIGTSVGELAQAVAGLCGRPARLAIRPARDGEIRHSVGDPSSGRLALDLGAATPISAGLAATLAWLEAGGFASAEATTPLAVPGTAGKPVRVASQ
jgi:UDP-glucose 4-epimerase